MVDSYLTELSTKISMDSINICNLLFTINEYEIGNQLKIACTGIADNIREAKYTENKTDLIHKLHMALKDCNQCIYCLDTIRLSILLEAEDTSNLYNNCYHLLRLLKSSIEAA